MNSRPVPVFRPLYSFSAAARMRHPLSAKCISDIKESFMMFDGGKKGWLNREELKLAMTSLLGYRPSKVEVQNLIPNKKGASEITLDRFVKLMSEKLSWRDPEDEIRQMFFACDYNGTGFITLDDLEKAFGELRAGVPHHIIEQIFNEVDVDKDGKVSYKDFETMMKLDA